MQDGALRSQRVVLTEQALQADSKEDKPDLAHGRAGKRSLQIDGEQCKQSPQQHIDQPKAQQQISPLQIIKEHTR